jgi:hypothetical protein
VLVFVLLATASCFLPARKADLIKSSGCPEATKYLPIYVDGYFGINPDKGISVDAGYESAYPYAKFAFSSEPDARTSLQANVIVANQGNNGLGKANRTEYPASDGQSKWPIYDFRGREISFHDRVRISGFLIEPCVFKVEKIEKLEF